MKPHEILGVKHDADFDTIKQAYLNLVKTTHPDAGGSKEAFVRVHTAYETLADRWIKRTRYPDQEPAGADTDADTGGDTGGDTQDRKSSRGYTSYQEPTDTHARWHADTRPYKDIVREFEERLAAAAGEFAEDFRRHAKPSGSGFWSAVVLTVVCASVVGTCLCYDGKPFEVALWSFSFVIAMGVLVYAGGMAAVLATSPGTRCTTMYLRVVVLVSFVATMIGLFHQSVCLPNAKPRAVISRALLPKWWPIQ